MAAPNLPTLYPTAYSSQTGTAWVSTTATNIDEDVASADGAEIQSGNNATSTIFFDITDTPSDFISMISLKYNIRYNLINRTDDTEVLYVQLFKSNKTTTLTNEMTIATNPATGMTNSGEVAFTGVSTTATKAEWDAAYERIRTAHTVSMSADGSNWRIDCINLVSGLYQASPTVALTSPSDGSSTSDNTPDLVFTGTDANGDDIRYTVGIDFAAIALDNSANHGRIEDLTSPFSDSFSYTTGTQSKMIDRKSVV